MSANFVSESEFHMWRAVFAFAFADDLFSIEEQELLRSYVYNVPFSPRQLTILKSDFTTPQNVELMYQKITLREHKLKFCALARALAWCDGDMDRQEKTILARVGCLNAESDILRESRDHPGFQDCHQHYIRAGVIGLARNYRIFETRA